MSTQQATAESIRTPAQSLQEYGRGIVGGLLFSIPLVYTQEMWHVGTVSSPIRQLIYVLITFVLLLAYNRFAGLRQDSSFTEVVIDSLEEMGLGLVLAALFFWMLRRLTGDMQPEEIIGRIVLGAMPIAIGVSIGTAQLGGDQENSGTSDDDKPERTFTGQMALALCGAVLVASNVAPTDEIELLATEMSTWRLIIIAIVSMLLGMVILFYSGFTGTKRGDNSAPTLYEVLFGITATYSISLVSSALMLWFFGRFDGMSFALALSETVVLGVVAMLGASAGRLLIQQGANKD